MRKVLIAWVVLSLLLILSGWQAIAAGRLADPDDIMRLVQVRDVLGGQGWFDPNQYRLAPMPDGSGGVPMHWSRLVDLPLIIVIGSLTPLLGAQLAETIALIAIPLLTLLVTLNFVGRLSARLFDLETAGWTCLVVGFMPLMTHQLQPLRIDHHVWQIATVAAALWAIHLAHRWRGGALAGLAMAIGLSISLELLPVAALFAGVLAFRWLRDRADRTGLVGFMQSLALSLSLLFALTKGFGDLTPYCDAITLAHCGLFITIALGVTALAVPPRLSPLLIAGGLAAAGLAGLALFGWASPTCLGTPFGRLDPVVHDAWYLNVPEGRPLWEQSADLYPVMLQFILALGVAVMLVWRAREERRWLWVDYTILLGGTILLGLFVFRSLALAAVVATIPFGYLLTTALRWLREAKSPLKKVAIGLATVPVLLPLATYAAAERLLADESSGRGVAVSLSSCELQENAKLLRAFPTATVFAPLDIGPSLLAQSPHSVVATGHHRAEAAMKDVIEGFSAPADEARAIVAKYDSKLVVVCTDLSEPRLYARMGGERSLAARLMADDAPQWLERVDIDAPDTFRVWRVRD